MVMYVLKGHGIQPPYEDSKSASTRWTLKRFKKDFRIEIKSSTPTELEFDMINISCPLANTLRRILLQEVPTMAIEKVFIYQNTSMIQDEVLSQRLGLIPLDVDPRLFNHLSSVCPETDNPSQLAEAEHLLFELRVKCTKDPSARAASALDPADDGEMRAAHGCRSVYAHELRWIPISGQRQIHQTRPPCPVRLTPDEPGILVAKLAPGQEIHLRCLAVKGVAKDHAKFSPVATASYRLHPRIRLLEPVGGEAALRLKACFPRGVIEVDARTGQARVANERLEVRNSREVLRVDELRGKVELGLDGNHFIFTVESTGAMTPVDIVEQAFQILMQKCDVIDIALSGAND